MKALAELKPEALAHVTELSSAMMELQNLRIAGMDKPAEDKNLGEFVKEKFHYEPDAKTGSPESFYHALGIDPSRDTLQSFLAMPDTDGRRHIIPEIIREAIRQGLDNPMWKDLIAAEENVRGLQIVTPSINMNNVKPKDVAEKGSIPMGEVRMEQKNVVIDKIGVGTQITYEVVAYSPMNMVSLALESVGLNLNHKINYKANAVLINGDQADGSLAAPVVGVISNGTLAYRDILRAWIRMGMLTKTPDVMMGGDLAMEDVLMLDEFRKKFAGTQERQLQIMTKLPQDSRFWPYGAVPDNVLVLVNTAHALVKFNAQSLLIESDKNIVNQVYNSVATVTTGFGNLNKDARLCIKKDVALGADGQSNGYPLYMVAGSFHKQFA